MSNASRFHPLLREVRNSVLSKLGFGSLTFLFGRRQLWAGRFVRLHLLAGVGGEKALQRVVRVFEGLLREEMACTHRLALNIGAPCSPEREWSTRLDIPGV